MSSWPVYLIVAALSAGAAVAIAGVPDDAPVEDTVRTPTVPAAPSTTRPPDVEPGSTAPPASPSTTTATSPTSTTTAPTTTSTSPATTAPITAAPTSTTTTTPPRTTTTAAPTITTTTPPPLLGRSDVDVSVANASIFGGLARRTAAALRELGYDDVVTTNGLEQTDVSVVYHRVGLRREAARLATDLGIAAPVRPLASAPPVLGGTDDLDLLAYLGNDR